MEDQTNKSKSRIQFSLKLAEDWLLEHFGTVLGENAILNKAIALLFTAFLLFFNYLKHQYDVGYYNEVFGVPKEYLGSAWNSTFSDFLFYALISILQSIITLIIFTFVVSVLIAVYISWHPQPDYTIRDLIIDFIKNPDGQHAIVLMFIFCVLIPTEPKLKLIVSLYVISLIGSIAMLIWIEYRLSRIKQTTYSQSYDIVKDDSMVYVEKLRKRKTVLICIVITMLFLSGRLSQWIGRQVAYDVRTLEYISMEDEIPQQLHMLVEEPDDSLENYYWAIIYRFGENYLIAPCIITEEPSKATIYTKYQCIIPSDGVVVASGSYSSISIARRQKIGADNHDAPENESSKPTETHIFTEPTNIPNSTEDTIPGIPESSINNTSPE